MKASTSPNSSCTSTVQPYGWPIKLRRGYHEPARIFRADEGLSIRCASHHVRPVTQMVLFRTTNLTHVEMITRDRLQLAAYIVWSIRIAMLRPVLHRRDEKYRFAVQYHPLGPGSLLGKMVIRWSVKNHGNRTEQNAYLFSGHVPRSKPLGSVLTGDDLCNDLNSAFLFVPEVV